jgi:adenylate kinase
VDSGRLVPDDLTPEAVTSRLGERDCAEGWVLDGFPRTEGQARALEEALGAPKAKLDAVLYLSLDGEVIVERMSGRRVCPKCGRTYHLVHMPPRSDEQCDECGSALVQRDDDAPETVRNRLATYERQTAPLVDYYEGRGLLVRVGGEGTPDEVGERLFEQLKKIEGA